MQIGVWTLAAVPLVLGMAGVSAGPLAAQDGVPAEATDAVDITPTAATRAADLRINEGAAPPLIPIANFAQGTSFRDFEMSPDGSRFTIARDVEGTSQLLVVDAVTRSVVQRAALPENSTINWVLWAGNDKLIMSVTNASEIRDIPVRTARLLVQHLDGKGAYFFEVKGGIFDGDNLIHLAEDGSYALV